MITISRQWIEGPEFGAGSDYRPATAKQQRILTRFGYSQSVINKLTSSEAYDMISNHVV